MTEKLIHGETLEYWKKNAEEDYLKVPISVLKYITCLEEALSIGVVGQSELCICKDKEGHSTNKAWCYECDKPTE